MPVFAQEEHQRRILRVEAAMEAAGIEVLICTDPANINYLTGYDGWSFYVHQCAVVALGAGEPLWIGRAMDTAGARLTAWIGEASLRPYDEGYVDSPERHPMEHVAAVLRAAGWGGRRIGIEGDSFSMTARAAEVLRARLPDARFEDAFALVNRVRLIKSPAELALMRIAGRIVARAMEEGIAAIAPGVRDCDVIGQITRAQIEGVDGHWGDYPATLAAVQAGPRSAAPHLTWAGERFQTGQVAWLELAGCHARYHAALARTVHLGEPPAALRRLALVVEEGLETALDAARAGATAEAVEAAWRRVIARAGYEKASRIGYSIGLGYPPDWGERTVSLRPGDRTELLPDMCFHMILGMWQEGSGYELSETLRITPDGPPELLTHYPRALVVKP